MSEDHGDESHSESIQIDKDTIEATDIPVDGSDADSEGRRIAALLKQASPHLPISKLKKIAKSDPEYIITSSSAFVASAFATELFIQSLTEETLALSHLSSKGTHSRNLRLTYNNISECVSRKENFQFLEDVVPKTKNLRTLVKENKVRYATVGDGQPSAHSAVSETKSSSGEYGSGQHSDNDDDDDEDEVKLEKEEEAAEIEDEELEEQLKEIEDLNRVENLEDDEAKDGLSEEQSDNEIE